MLKHGSGLIDLAKKAICTTCKIEKPNTEFKFYKNRVNPITGLCLYTNKKCKNCSKDYMVHKKKSVLEVKNQGIIRPIPSKANPYKCDNCSKDIITTKTLQLDHCHLTGKFRGWLCKECNISLGNLGDSIEGLFKTVKYLNKTQQKSIDELHSILDSV
jgi:hypothetical protein